MAAQRTAKGYNKLAKVYTMGEDEQWVDRGMGYVKLEWDEVCCWPKNVLFHISSSFTNTLPTEQRLRQPGCGIRPGRKGGPSPYDCGTGYL